MASSYPSGKPRAILPPLVVVYAQPESFAAVAQYVQRVQAEARQKTKVIYVDTATGRPVTDVLDGTDKIQDVVYPWSKDSILRELLATFETELGRSGYGTFREPEPEGNAQFRRDIAAVLEASQLAADLQPPPRVAAKLRSPPIMVTDSQKLLHFFNRPVVLNTLGDAMARHALPPLIPLCAIRDLDPISCRVENQPLEWGSEELQLVLVHRPLPNLPQKYPDLWRRPLSAYTCVTRRMPKGFTLVFGKYELMQDGDCICRFVLHPEGQFEWWQSRKFRDEDQEKAAGRCSGASTGLWTVGPGSCLTLEGAFNHITSNIPRVHEKIVLSLEWLAQSWTVTEMQTEKLCRPYSLQALERAPWPTLRCGTYTYQQIAPNLADHGHVRGNMHEDVKITLILFDTGWYEYTEERRLHRARKQTTTAVHLGRSWEMDPEQRVVRLKAPTKQALRMRRYETGTQFEDYWVGGVEIPLARLDAEFAYYPFSGGEYPEGVAEPHSVITHNDLSSPMASLMPLPNRRLITGGTSWQCMDASAPMSAAKKAAAQMLQSSQSSWRSSWKSGAFKANEIMKRTGSAPGLTSRAGSSGPPGSNL